MQSILWRSILILCIVSVGYGRPPHLGVGRLIIGKLVRLRRTVAESKAVKESEVAPAVSQEESEELVISPKDKESTGKPDLDGKILLLMIVPPDKLKDGKEGKEGHLRRKPMVKKKNKRKILTNIVTKPKASKCRCAAELAKQLDIDVDLATQLLTNSTMELIATVACTKNACPTITKLSDVLNSKIKFISDVRPVITCEESTTAAPSCPQKERDPCGGDKDSKDSKSDKDTKGRDLAVSATTGRPELKAHLRPSTNIK